MCAYNKVNGPYACENRPLLEDILRDDWGFKGLTIADYGAVHDAGASLQQRAGLRALAGCRLRPGIGQRRAGDAARRSMADVDEHVRRYPADPVRLRRARPRRPTADEARSTGPPTRGSRGGWPRTG